VSWSADGKRLVSLGRDNETRIWSLESGQTDAILYPLIEGAYVLFTTDGRILANRPGDFDTEFSFLVERPSGQMESVSYAEFARRAKLETR
jgi:hypothetical protein